MRAGALLLVALVGCGEYTPDLFEPGDAAPEPTCAVIEAGPCYVGWSTLPTVLRCEPGASPNVTGCVQDDTDASPYWCCP